MSALPILELDSVEADIAGSRILRGVSLTVEPGEVVALMGRNGVGKTTTLRTITGLLSHRSGEIRFENHPINRVPIDRRARNGIAHVPQGRDIFPHLTVGENLQAGLTVKRRSRSEAKEALDRVYDLFPVLREMLKRKGGVLSGGQQQQLAIGRALLTGPKLLILDEPTEGIQPNIVREIGDVITRLNRESGLTVLLVEQKLPFARRIGTDLRILDKGRLVVSGPISDLTDEVVREHLTV